MKHDVFFLMAGGQLIGEGRIVIPPNVMTEGMRLRIKAEGTVNMAEDPINHPRHYNSHPSGIECITIARHHTFNIGNVLKYVWRAGLKIELMDGTPTAARTRLQDLRKARWYLDDEIKKLEGETS